MHVITLLVAVLVNALLRSLALVVSVGIRAQTLPRRRRLVIRGAVPMWTHAKFEIIRPWFPI